MKGLDETKGILIASLNIIAGWAGGLEAVLWALQKGDIDVGVFQEAKLKQGICTHYGAGYAVWEAEAESRH